MMKQDKDKLNDLLSQVQQLNEKYQIKDFTEELKSVFKLIDISDDHVDEFLKNPYVIMQSGSFPLANIDPAKLTNCLNQYHKIKKKYKYESYIREGHALRKNFLRQRKNYIFNSSKFIKFTSTSKSSTLEKLNMDYAEQQFIAKWIDKLLKKIYPKTLMIEYEALDGSVRTAEIRHHKIEVTPDYVDAPLIDRLVGEFLFDTFLLHSFYDVKTESYRYFPVKFIIKMLAKDHPSAFEIDDDEQL
jgi:hypothetical protein